MYYSFVYKFVSSFVASKMESSTNDFTPLHSFDAKNVGLQVDGAAARYASIGGFGEIPKHLPSGVVLRL